ncbi:hypothetical protein SF83666_b64690 (plasmid) [Sinorhizobium fredii CCBAU 83666]|nr:hypothetical protein SF83666_b64690 [Sinorhizobium fredii CCBAU 83666]
MKDPVHSLLAWHLRQVPRPNGGRRTEGISCYRFVMKLDAGGGPHPARPRTIASS